MRSVNVSGRVISCISQDIVRGLPVIAYRRRAGHSNLSDLYTGFTTLTQEQVDSPPKSPVAPPGA